MRCADIMRRDVQGCRANETLRSVAIRMKEENVGFLPVRDQDDKVVGAITDRDIVVRAVADGLDDDSTRVEQVMTNEIYFVRESDPMQEAEDLMARRRIQRVLVMNELGILVGIISLSDIGARDWGWRVARTVRAVAHA